ncbi:hypothetical protein HNQ35_000050 [Cerasibacillus quisquiliarum]|uniref:Uncharacterized protein n=1 Tax=Cerasibacillus quisquiliarum TaxID=227865 RepID=A0A511UWX0_9BACI|nr:hypothetical protein [Cerasibacillus quisquiliarum]MBB5144861.1 hypothetical protein [Cerasibacillus quisquiliarum]GEN30248.1 hypothetical protein CQU01_04860 [Cerasibacillus quisquiliarum]
MKVSELIKHLEEFPNKDAKVAMSAVVTLKKSNKVIPTMAMVEDVLVPLDKNDKSMIVLKTKIIEENI